MVDVKFSSLLHSTLQDIGRKGRLAAPESQDPLDPVLHEYFVADTGRAVFTKRCTLAKDAAIAKIRADEIERIVGDARKNKITSHGELAHTEHYLLTLKANSPVTATDIDIFQVELVKAGVDPEVINGCLERAIKTREPAKNFHIVSTITR